MQKKNSTTIALVGNPNVGKSTFFNTLTGARQKVGNWPGKTVEKKEGLYFHKGQSVKIVDLPGSYSLNAYSEEEKITSSYLRLLKPTYVIQIIDAQNISRNLFLSTQLLDLDLQLIFVLNMSPRKKRTGVHKKNYELSKVLNVPIYEIDVRKKQAVHAFVNTILSIPYATRTSNYPCIFRKPAERYAFIKGIEKTYIETKYVHDRIVFDAHIDRIAINKYMGIPVFAGISLLMFQITYMLSEPIIHFIESIFEFINRWATAGLSVFSISPFIISLITDGVIDGVGGVLIFVPTIAILFFCISLLEDSGYMARVAYNMDRFTRRIGLHGRAFIPLLLGFGCNVPAIMATRMLDTKEDRLLTILINPFMSCSARLPVYMLFTSLFFPKHQTLVIFSLYFLGIFTAIFVAMLFSKLIIKRTPQPFFIELPPYRVPSLRVVLMAAWHKVMQYIKKAGTVILILSVIIWFFSHYPYGNGNVPENSYFGLLGKTISPIFAPLGFGNWKASVALLFGTAAKEVIVATLNTLYGVVRLGPVLRQDFTPLSAYSFLVFTLLYVPCIATLVIVKKETNSWKWPIFMVFYTTIIAWMFSFVIFQTGRLFGL